MRGAICAMRGVLHVETLWPLPTMYDTWQWLVTAWANAWEVCGPIHQFVSDSAATDAQIRLVRDLLPERTHLLREVYTAFGTDRPSTRASFAIARQTAGAVICLDGLHHVWNIPQAIEQMTSLLAPGGMLVLSTRLHEPLSDHPQDYWRMSPAAMSRLLMPLAGSLIGWQGPSERPHTLFGIGFKGPLDTISAAGADRFIEQFQHSLQMARFELPMSWHLETWLASLWRGRRWRRARQEWLNVQFALDFPMSHGWPLHLSGPHASLSTGTRLDLID